MATVYTCDACGRAMDNEAQFEAFLSSEAGRFASRDTIYYLMGGQDGDDRHGPCVGISARLREAPGGIRTIDVCSWACMVAYATRRRAAETEMWDAIREMREEAAIVRRAFLNDVKASLKAIEEEEAADATNGEVQ